jgi:hypothetical protein
MLDYIGIFKRFNEEDVRYLVVGGLAMNLLLKKWRIL